MTTKLRAESKEYQNKELKNLAGQSERVDIQLQRIQDALQIIQSKDTASSEAITAIQNAVKETQEGFKSGFASWSETLLRSCEKLCVELEMNGIGGLTTVSL